MSKMKRREFLAVGATAAVGLSLFNKNVRAALAAARQAGKPMLTERNLNSFVKANPPHTQKGQEVFAEAASNLDGFVEKYFHLTEEQRREFATISPEDKRKLTDTIEQARKEKKPIQFSIVSRTVGKSRLAHAPYPVPLKSTTISIGVTAFGSFFGVKFTKETTDDKNTNGNTNKPNPS